jgi:hypothetical protein
LTTVVVISWETEASFENKATNFNNAVAEVVIDLENQCEFFRYQESKGFIVEMMRSGGPAISKAKLMAIARFHLFLPQIQTTDGRLLFRVLPELREHSMQRR